MEEGLEERKKKRKREEEEGSATGSRKKLIAGSLMMLSVLGMTPGAVADQVCQNPLDGP
jgi:hypothetical protein